MKAIAAISSLLLLGAATAQEIQSKPFYLVIQSANKTLNGEKLSACHSGAAIESLCLAGDGSQFNLNTTTGEVSPIKGQAPAGTLIWKLPYSENGETAYESEPMSFYNDPSTNVAMPMFEPSYDMQQVMFDQQNRMGIYSYLDDTVTPPTGDTPKILRNWYVCETYYTGYTYTTLNWVMGDATAKPQNPSCVKVQVQRSFV